MEAQVSQHQFLVLLLLTLVAAVVQTKPMQVQAQD
jgi:hypothetical protein